LTMENWTRGFCGNWMHMGSSIFEHFSKNYYPVS
jgi:hypothetical protein